MDGFLQQTARSIIEKLDWQQLSRTTFVLPSHRAGLVLKDELLRLQQERHAQAVWAPKVQTLTQLQDALSPLYAEDELFTIVRLYRHYSALNTEDSDLMPLEMFYGWGRQMLADFTNVDASMPAEEVPNFFDNTVAAHELGQWLLDEETEERLCALLPDYPKDEHASVSADSIRAQYEHLWQQIYELYSALRAEMEAEQKGYPGMRQRAVIEHWEDEYVQSKIAGRTFVFVGFNYLLPVERDLMVRLRDTNQSLFYWDYVRDFQTNSKAFSFAEINSGILGSALPPREPITRNPIPVTLISCVSREAQAQYVHRWLQENYTAKGQKVGVVICDETMLEPVIYTLPAIFLPDETEPAAINITKGFPLRNTAIYARILRWLNDRKRGKADDVLSPDFIEQMLAEVFTPQTEETNANTDTNTNALTWQELLILESEYQARKIANQMRTLITKGIDNVPFTLKLLRLLMRRTMESVTMPFHGEPVTDLQVMGVLETRLLDFDKLLLLNVEEGIIPQRQSDNSFIPFYLRKAYHMQTSDERATVYAYNFFRLLSRSGEATLLYASADTAEGGKGQSRFIMQMLYSPEFTVQKRTLQEQSVLATPQAVSAVVTQPLALKRLSPSALNTYISCPYSFYLQYVLGLRPKEDESVVFLPSTMGSFVHEAMEYIYGTYLHCDSKHITRVSPDEIEAIRTSEARLDEALAHAYEQMNDKWLEDHPNEPNHYVPEHHSAENIIVKGYVSNILERDEEDAKTGLKIVLLERWLSFSLPIEGVGEIELGGIIDRLDIYGPEGNECLRVIDYKSGGYNDTTHAKKMSASWEELMDSEDKGYVRQTLIYSHAVHLANLHKGLRIEPNLFFCRRKLTEIVTSIDVEGQTVHDYAQLQALFIPALQAKVKQILTATQFPQCDEDKCPSFCPFFTLCGRKANEF